MATVLITGCNRGIGLELVKLLAERGEHVIGVCRQASPQLRELDVELIEGIDVSDAEAVAELARKLDGRTIDVLVNNAGILRADEFGAIDYDDMLEQYRVNTLGPLRVTEALRSNLSKSGKVVIVSSRVGSIEDNGSGNYYGYRASKTAVNQVGMNLHHELSPQGIAVGLLHPGLVATEMTGGQGVAPSAAAAGLLERIDELEVSSSGGFWHAEGYRLPW